MGGPGVGCQGAFSVREGRAPYRHRHVACRCHQIAHRVGSVRQPVCDGKQWRDRSAVTIWKPIAPWVLVPTVFGRNLQCKPVRGVNLREECHWSHHVRFMFASSEHVWDPMASSSVTFCRKTRTIPRVCRRINLSNIPQPCLQFIQQDVTEFMVSVIRINSFRHCSC
jgi:hypothetical protein